MPGQGVRGYFMLIAAVVLAVAPTTLQATPAASAEIDRQEAYYHYSLGMQAQLTGDSDTALAEYHKAQALDPSASAIRVETARLLREMGRLDDARKEAEAAVALDGEDPDAHLILAQLLQVQASGVDAEQTLKAAASHYEAVVRLRPKDGQSLLHLAGIYGQLQDHVNAARIWGLYLELDPGNFEAHVQRGTHLLLAGKSDEAAEAMKAALELHPGSARAYQILGDIYARADETDEAIEDYKKALEIEPDNIRVRLALGEMLQQAHKPEDGLAQAQAALGIDPANRFALDLKGRCLRDLRRFDEADAVADTLIAGDPKDLKASFLKVTIAESRRDFEKAAALLEEIVARPSGSDEESEGGMRTLLVHLGFAYQQLQRYDDAAAAFARALKEGPPPDENLLSFHAEALYLAKQKDAALTAVRAARERFPDDADLTGLEATLLREKGDLDGGIALVEAMREKAPSDPKVLGRVADFYRRARRLPEAEAALRQALAADPKSLSTLFQLGAVLEREKRQDDAEAVFRQALEVEPESAPVLNYLGYMNADRNVKVEEALSLIQKAVDLEPDSPAYRDSLGWALFRLNRLGPAEEEVRRALDKDGDNAVILDHLGDILAKRGQVAEALQCWQKALKGEDEDEELDRPTVEAKVRDAQGALQAQQQRTTPPTP
jgi:tetratricopeptide (TPR) repeat protein